MTFHQKWLKNATLSVAVLSAAVTLGCSQQAPSSIQVADKKSEKQNLIFVLADDMGYGDLSVNGQQSFTTPNLDQMANDGIRFTDFYAGSSVCAPSRSVLMTGQHQGHTRIRANLMNIKEAPGFKSEHLQPEDITIGDIFQQAGYTTGIIGKWGLGELNDSGHPNEQGFDYFYGYLNHIHAHNHFPDHLYRNKERVELKNEVIPSGCGYCYKFGFEGQITPLDKRVEYADDLIREESLQFIERNKDKPFFLMVSLVSPHANNEANDVDWAHGLEIPSYGKYANKDWPDTMKGYAAMIDHIDTTVGLLIDKVKSAGIEDKTIVMFSADNGPHQEAGGDPYFFKSSGQFRGMKRDLYEGGIRMPTLAWGGPVAKGVVSDHIGYFGDFMATASEMTGVALPADRDSVSFLPTLLGQDEAQKDHEYIYWEFYAHGSSQAVRMGQYKAVRLPMWTGPIEIYDLEKDPSETTNIAAQHPELVAKFAQIMTDNNEITENWQPDTKGTSPDRLRQQGKGFQP